MIFLSSSVSMSAVLTNIIFFVAEKLVSKVNYALFSY